MQKDFIITLRYNNESTYTECAEAQMQSRCDLCDLRFHSLENEIELISKNCKVRELFKQVKDISRLRGKLGNFIHHLNKIDILY